MNISGVLVHTYPQYIDAISQRLDEIDGVEVHAVTDAGKIVITIEKPDDRGMSESVLQLQNLDGVLNASVIFHQFED